MKLKIESLFHTHHSIYIYDTCFEWNYHYKITKHSFCNPNSQIVKNFLKYNLQDLLKEL